MVFQTTNLVFQKFKKESNKKNYINLKILLFLKNKKLFMIRLIIS
jgi:hypothetical protein